MADEKEVVKDGSVASTSTENQTGSTTTPVVEQTTVKTTEKEVPYDRFQEVIKQKNSERQLREQYEARLKELEGRLPSGSNSTAEDKLVKRLVASGMKLEAAQLIADTSREATREALEPLQKRENDRQVDSWAKELERSDPDYKKLKPHLEKAFDSLSDNDKRFSVSTPQGLEWFYNKVKLEHLNEEIVKARAEGVKQGYDGKGQKEGLAATPKSATATETALTFESIRGGAIKKMSDDEYKRRKPEIDAIVAKGPTQK